MVHTKVRQEWEARYVSQYLVDKFPDRLTMHRVPLGEIPQVLQDALGPPTAKKWFRPSRPVADAIAITPDALILIEGKIFDPNRGIGQLYFYERLIGFTPELQRYKDLPVRLRLVTARLPPWASHAEAFPEIEIEEYQPEWIEEYYKHLQSYWTGENRQMRQIKKEKLIELGFT